jgi:DNA primase
LTVIDDIKSRLDITDVVSKYVTLQRSGANSKANCPFHQEKTPSFYVFPDRQSWRCFGACATGGDVFSFVMRAENLEFKDTLERLAQQAGVELPKRQERAEQRSATDINEEARVYFQRLLASDRGKSARDYLERRGLSQEAVDKFEMGLSPGDGQSLRNHLEGQGFSPQQMDLAGVTRTMDSGQQRDLFRGRLMFPIRNGQGGLGGFGARALDDSQPKYLNSPRSPVFDKSRILYALHLAKDSARQQGVVIVEGYMDAIAAHEKGFTNVVASMGTAITEHQVAEIRRITGDVTMALDADAAGQQATLRSLDSSWRVFQSPVAGRARGSTLFQRPEMADLKIAVMPEGQDPDDLIRRSPEDWRELIEHGTPLVEYLLGALARESDPSTPQGKAHIVGVVLPLIQAVPEPFQQDHYFQKLADTLNVTRESLLASIDRPRTARRAANSAPTQRRPAAPGLTKTQGDPVEEYCLSLLLRHSEQLGAETDALRPEYFRRLENREILNQWMWFCERGEFQPAKSLSEFVAEELQEALDDLLQREYPPLEPHRLSAAFQTCVTNLEARYLRDLKVEEGMRFAEAATSPIEELYSDVLEVNQRIKENQEARGSALKVRTSRGR